MRAAILFSSVVLALLAATHAESAILPPQAPVPPVANATIAGAEYCYLRARGLDPDHVPQAHLVLRLRVAVSYVNAGRRALILPLEHERTIYASLAPGPMSALREPFSFFRPVHSVMKHLPDDVNPDDPSNPPNRIFGIIPAAGEMTADVERITIPIEHPRGLPVADLRGRALYLRLSFEHRELTEVLDAVLSDRWTRFGIPWSGTVRTGTLLINIPAAPQAKPCEDSHVDR